MPDRRAAGLVVLLGLIALAGAGYAAWRQDWTYDEPQHVAWSERLLDTRETERESRLRYNSKTPVSLLNVLARRAGRTLGATSPEADRFSARLATVAALGALLVATFLVARPLAGARAAALATAGLSLDPNLAAHGSLATVDLYYALSTLLALGAACAWARRPGLARAVLMGAALGLALCTKFTAVLLAVGLLLAPLARDWRGGGAGPRPARIALHGAVSLAAALGLLAAAYLFIDVAAPLRDARWRSAPFAALAGRLPGLRLPVPLAFLTGIDATLATDRDFAGTVILGRLYPDGVLYYFPVLWLLKTPLLLLAAQALGLLLLARRWRVAGSRPLLFLGLNLLLLLAYFGIGHRTQIGYRFVLMGLPLAWILAGAGLATLRGRRVGLLAGLVIVASLAEAAPYLGNPLSFTNALVWPKREAFRLIADSNLDWGQNRDKIDGWLAARGVPPARLDPVQLLPGVNVFSVNTLAGVFAFERHRWARENVSPIEHLGHTYLLLDVEQEEHERFMNETRRLSPEPVATALCGDGAGRTLLEPRAPLGFERDQPPVAGRAWLLCVSTETGCDLGYRSLAGVIRVGRVREGRCVAELVREDQVAWYRLAPGTHALCAVEVPNRRPRLAYRTLGQWTARGGRAALRLTDVALEAAEEVRPEGP
jgi:hypothetical protein